MRYLLTDHACALEMQHDGLVNVMAEARRLFPGAEINLVDADTWAIQRAEDLEEIGSIVPVLHEVER